MLLKGSSAQELQMLLQEGEEPRVEQKRGAGASQRCGEVCGRPPAWAGCVELRHAGPCPLCLAVVTVVCVCGKQSRGGRCGEQLGCGEVCDKELGCGVHTCQEVCHQGECVGL